MMKAGILTLITATPEGRGAFDAKTETRRDVYCTVKSVGYREVYEAISHGLFPEIVFCLSHDFEYHGERKCEFEGTSYEILRSYATEADGIELTAQRGRVND